MKKKIGNCITLGDRDGTEYKVGQLLDEVEKALAVEFNKKLQVLADEFGTACDSVCLRIIMVLF